MKKIQSPQQVKNAHELFGLWKQADQRMEEQLEDFRDWMLEMNELPIPRYSEAGDRLADFRSVLVDHFESENDLCEQLASFYDDSSPELEGMSRQASRDHSLLLNRLDRLIDDLKAIEPPFSSWRGAMDDVGLFIDALDQHEEQEFESVQTLIPRMPRTQ